MKISDVRSILKEKQYLLDKTIDIESVVSGIKYEFVCSKGHIFQSLPINAIGKEGRLCCPICSNRQVLIGVNDMWTTSPELAKYLENPEDGYTHTKSSNQPLKWVCPECKHSFLKTPNKMSFTKIKCQYCNMERSYSEKFVTAFLEQCGIDFYREKYFPWSQNKRYDFYIPCFRLIIETNGKQHYKESFAFSDSRTLLEEKQNDTLKYNLANQSGEAVSNTTKEICEAYSKTSDLYELCELFHLSINSVRDKLKYGAKLGWCDYNPKESINEAHKKSARYVVKNLSKPVVQINSSDEVVAEFNSIQEAQRLLNISHIWDCVSGKRKTAGGYKWRYKDD